MQKNTRRVLGYTLLAICALAWLVVFIVPFLDVGLGQGAAIVTVLIVAGEGAFLLGIALLGKDVFKAGWAAIKRLRRELQR